MVFRLDKSGITSEIRLEVAKQVWLALRALADSLEPIVAASKPHAQVAAVAKLEPTRVHQNKAPATIPHRDRPHCAIDGCGKDEKCKGYCGSHYQKRLLLIRKNELPIEWTEYAKPGTVPNIGAPKLSATEEEAGY